MNAVERMLRKPIRRLSPSVHFSSATVEWPTPKAVYEQLDEEFRFDFDPCPVDGDSDGLASLLTPWRGRRVFCNPPYGPQIRKWLERADEAEVAVYLIPARTDTRWFHDIVLPKAKEIRFIKGRLKFGEAKNSAPFPSMIAVFEVCSPTPRTKGKHLDNEKHEQPTDPKPEPAPAPLPVPDDANPGGNPGGGGH